MLADLIRTRKVLLGVSELALLVLTVTGVLGMVSGSWALLPILVILALC